jgi:methyltransferase-like protein/2-polyprenyl-3-methyl-5-hydroxy-6-metoxy-1,4-benzoquinol methylase
MSDLKATSYDEVPYESYPFSQSHPDRLATIATLLGLKPPPVGRCRVLELGCASGGNLIPMALTLPETTFLGIDLSRRQIADGQRVVDTLGLKNIELRQQSILDVTPEMGRFDYIICHGIYSWVPPSVQDKILDICRDNLAPDGVAYVSYNTFPGWHMRSMIRRMMLYHASHFQQPQARLQQARALLDFLVQSAGQENSPYSAILKSEVEIVRNSRDSYLFHDHLEECNDPIYFYEFVERVNAKGLRYLGEADLSVMVPRNFRPEVEQVLQRLSTDIIHTEQYMDFVRNRMFRQTLLCHQGLTPIYGVTPERLLGLYVASPAKPVSATPDIHSNAPEEFRGLGDITLTSQEPLVKAAMTHLAEGWPREVPFEVLRDTARARLDAPIIADEITAVRDTQRLGECLLTFYTSASTRLVDFHVYPTPMQLDISERPVASPLARLQAEAGNNVTNLRHELITLEHFNRHVVRHLDGTRDRAALLDILAELVAKDVLTIRSGDAVIRDAPIVRGHLSTALEAQLPRLARLALLVG